MENRLCPECFSSNVIVDKLKQTIKCKHCGKKFKYEKHECAGVNIPIYVVTKVIK